MKVTLCDVCYYMEDKLVKGRFRMGYVNGVKMDVCEQHKSFVKGCKNNLELTEKYFNLVNSRSDLA